MAIQLELTNRSDHPTENLRSIAEQRLEHLRVLQPRATHCRVAVEKPHAHATSGNSYEVVVTLHVPSSNELVAREQPGKHAMHETVESILRHAFAALESQVKETLARQRRSTKRRRGDLAIVAQLPNEEGEMGILQTEESGEVPFGARAVTNGEGARLTVGSMVRFDTAIDDEGVRATTVKLVDKPGVRHERA